MTDNELKPSYLIRFLFHFIFHLRVCFITAAMTNIGRGGLGPYEEVEVDILRGINHPEERRPVAVNDGAHTQRPAFVSHTYTFDETGAYIQSCMNTYIHAYMYT